MNEQIKDANIKGKFIQSLIDRVNELDRLLHETNQREWVGLHLDDMPDEHVVDRSFLRGARWAEVRLKEKNT